MPYSIRGELKEVNPQLVVKLIKRHKYGDILLDVFNNRTGEDVFSSRICDTGIDAFRDPYQQEGSVRVLAANLKKVFEDPYTKLMFRVRGRKHVNLSFLLYHFDGTGHPLNIFLPTEPNQKNIVINEEEHTMYRPEIPLEMYLEAADITKELLSKYPKS